MTLVLQDMVTLLEAANVGSFGGGSSSGGWPIFIGSEPDTPNNIITLYDMPGGVPNPKWRLDYPRFLARTRSLAYDQGFNKATELRNALLGLPSQDINGIRYVGIWVVQDTFFLKADGRNRSIFVTTFRIIREPTDADNRQPL